MLSRETWATVAHSNAFKLTAYVLSAIFIGALVTPPLCWFGTSLFQSGALEGKSFLGVDLHDELRRAKLPRYLNRGMLFGALVSLWPTIRWLGTSPKKFLRLEPNPHRFRQMGIGFALAAGGLLLLGWGIYAGGVFGPHPNPNPLVEVLFAALFAALCVAFLEEFFFRGCVLGLALETSSTRTAMIFTALFFAAVHFLKPPEHLPMPDPVTWISGFWLVGQIFAQFGNPMFILAEFITLTLVGFILGYARLQTRSLWLAIGLHAGWVFGIKAYGGLTRRSMGLEETLPWIGKDLKSGLAAVLVVGITGALVWWWLPRTSNRRQLAGS
ncbi:MAG: CPBP family intramembrane glutamic endopeptidase [Verrucomicrobiota bacterium]